MKKAYIKAVGNGNWYIEGLNFDVSQFSKIGYIMDVTELINFANTKRVEIINKSVLKDADKLLY